MNPEILSENVEIYNADCQDILASFSNIETIITDPPYGMSFRSNHRKEKYELIVNDDTTDLIKWICKIPAFHSKYIFCRWNNLYDVPCPKSFITWIKNNWGMGDLQHEHARQTEGILFYPGSKHFFPDKRPVDIIYADRTGNKHHPTEKPISLMMDIIKFTSGTIIDPFMGSGSTGIASIKLGRKFIGIEKDPIHYETAKQRLLEEIKKKSSSIMKLKK